MNKKNEILAGIILLFVFLGGVGFLMLTKNKPQSQSQSLSPNTDQPQIQNTTTDKAQGTLQNLLAGGKSLKCSFTNSATDSAKVSGSVFVSGGKMRGDFETTAGVNGVGTHMIVDSQNSYVWTDMSKAGFKFAITEQQKNAAAKNQGPDLNQTVDYSCENWSTDASVFTLPADITFSALVIPSIPVVSPGSSNGVSSQCAICDNVPAGSGRDACKAQLKCP